MLIKPVEPNFKDFPKESTLSVYESSYTIAMAKYYSDLEKYSTELKIEQQTKFIKDVQRSNIKLCLKKYIIVKNPNY